MRFQAVSSQAFSSSQATSADLQAVSTSASQAGSSWEDSASQTDNTSSPKTVSSQAVSSQAVSSSQPVSTDPQVVSICASLGGSPLEDSTFQAASASSQIHSTNSQGASATLPQASQANRQSNSTNTPWVSPKRQLFGKSQP